MTKYIVHKGTGTIIAVDECVIVDVSESVLKEIAESGGDDYFDDEVILALAVLEGAPINTEVASDVNPYNSVIFSPSFFREEARERTQYDDEDGNPFADFSDQYTPMWKWVLNQPDSVLEEIGRIIYFTIDEEFSECLSHALREVYHRYNR